MEAYVSTGASSLAAIEFLQAAVLNAGEPEIAEDVLRAAVYAFSGDGVPTPSALLGALRFFIQLANRYENILFVVASLVEEYSDESVYDRQWLQSAIQEYGTELAAGQVSITGGGRELQARNFDQFRMIEIPSQMFVQGVSATGALRPLDQECWRVPLAINHRIAYWHLTLIIVGS